MVQYAFNTIQHIIRYSVWHNPAFTYCILSCLFKKSQMLCWPFVGLVKAIHIPVRTDGIHDSRHISKQENYHTYDHIRSAIRFWPIPHFFSFYAHVCPPVFLWPHKVFCRWCFSRPLPNVRVVNATGIYWADHSHTKVATCFDHGRVL